MVGHNPDFGQSKEYIVPLFECFDNAQGLVLVGEIRMLRVRELLRHEPRGPHGLPVVALAIVRSAAGRACVAYHPYWGRFHAIDRLQRKLSACCDLDALEALFV